MTSYSLLQLVQQQQNTRNTGTRTVSPSDAGYSSEPLASEMLDESELLDDTIYTHFLPPPCLELQSSESICYLLEVLINGDRCT